MCSTFMYLNLPTCIMHLTKGVGRFLALGTLNPVVQERSRVELIDCISYYDSTKDFNIWKSCKYQKNNIFVVLYFVLHKLNPSFTGLALCTTGQDKTGIQQNSALIK
ncbi:hypothetical protein J5N97_016444 [Dioscorea zingiberensis]|uniref:Uncharacterized protein n=1 Tax=Dioscorea zingiberensis TaxID=325984 RepID=A0A9D5HFE3_9LILI|nr:hypothetical protein J5N97_016444 [Dioscorea zingiberensis]